MVMRPEFRAFLERVIREEGGVQAADKAAGLPPGTFSRMTTRTIGKPRPDTVIRLANTVGGKRGVTLIQLLAAAGIIPPQEAPDPLRAAPPLQEQLAGYHEELGPDAYRELLVILEERARAYVERHRESKPSDQ